MIIIIGLGNPGTKFNGTRHNVGFEAIDLFLKEQDFPAFESDKKSNALLSEDLIGGMKVLLVKPQTFMNESGDSIKQLLKQNKAASLVVVHDDIDLPVGKIKIIKERGSAGHKGVESIIKNIGNEGLIRIRIGIAGKKDVEAMSVVLKKFTKEEQPLVAESLQKASKALDLLVKGSLDKAMNEYNQ